MFETFFDLPVHILVIHGVVVGVPLVALANVAMVVLPGLRVRLAWPVVLLNAMMVGATYVARESGIWFYDRLSAPPPAADHRQLGLNLIWFVLGLFAASLLFALVARAGRLLVGAVALVVLGAAGAATVETILVGHSGSSAVWKSTISSTSQ